MIEKHKLGMAMFLLSETFFFAVLILVYVTYRGAAPDGPTAASSLNVASAAIFTAFLLGSSGTLWLAEQSQARERPAQMRLWLLVTVVLGATFLIGQGWEYLTLIGENVTIARNLFGSTFFTLTGFHGLHVFSGVVALAILFALARSGWLDGPHAIALETVGWYWHFVDVVWIIIFSIIYIWPLVA
jgi:heme/copper-type cytochrome/quinol oxidase subunit 3